MTEANSRISEYPIDKLFLERWSPRAFTGEEITEAELLTLIEAGSWAPSSYNVQPWRFLYARKGTAHWDKFLDLLIPFNQSWAKNAAALVILVSDGVVVSRSTGEASPSHSHSVDAGAAWAQFALQATISGWQAHGMVGFDIPRAAIELNLPETFRVEIAIAVGRQGDKSLLPEEMQAREMPSPRKPVKEIAMEGGFKA